MYHFSFPLKAHLSPNVLKNHVVIIFDLYVSRWYFRVMRYHLEHCGCAHVLGLYILILNWYTSWWTGSLTSTLKQAAGPRMSARTTSP